MAITRQIGHHLLRSAERPLCVDNPLRLAPRGQEGCGELTIGHRNTDLQKQKDGEPRAWAAVRRQVILRVGNPLLRGAALALESVPVAAGVVCNGGIGAVLAARDMATERCSAAVLVRRHHLQLLKAEMAGVGSAPCRAMVA